MKPTNTHTSEPVGIIFDTDIGNDIDDALALAMLHAFESRKEIKLLAVTITKDNPWAAPYVEIVNTFYSRPHIPIGVVRNGKTPEDHPMLMLPVHKRHENGEYVYPRTLADGSKALEAVALLRQVLAGQPDKSVIIIQVGFSTNLARLLTTGADAISPLNGVDLVKNKVRLLTVMAGAFPTGEPEYNIYTDIPAAKLLFAAWPTAIVASGFEVGKAIMYPASSIETHFAYTAHHPVVDAYKSFDKMPYNRPTWDLTAVLFAVRPHEGYFSLSQPGEIEVKNDGKTTFRTHIGGKHYYLKADKNQCKRVGEAFIYLVSQPPAGK